MDSDFSNNFACFFSFVQNSNAALFQDVWVLKTHFFAQSFFKQLNHIEKNAFFIKNVFLESLRILFLQNLK